jgi:Contractile injection system tube protein
MPGPDNAQNGFPRLEKAKLKELNADFSQTINSNRDLPVQFNPETLKVVYANQLHQPGSPGDHRGPPAQLWIGSSSTKMNVTLWFDIPSHPDGQSSEIGGDVRKLTEKVAYFITPTDQGDDKVCPAVRFVWGTFRFDGIIESMEETLEFFSPEGKPLRAQVALSMSRQQFTFGFNDQNQQNQNQNTPTPGTRPLTQSSNNDSVQNMASQQGRGNNWQSIAEANNVENPRLLPLGSLIDINIGRG